MADQKIELEIVLDDGSIKKAFGTIKNEAEKAGKESTTAFGFNPIKLLGLEAGFELFDRFSEKIKQVGEKMIELSLEAEKVRVTQAQFAAFTEQAGIATERFDAQIQKSIAGLLDDDDALQTANQAMIRIGLTAQRLPEIFELARKASASGFGDMASNAEAFTLAIQTGQTRQLRALGITADVTKAQEKFALSIGLTVAQLNEQQKAFVNANVILEAAGKKFNNVDGEIKSFSDSLARFKVASAEAFERFAVGFDKVFGPTLKGFIDTLTVSLNGNGAALKANAISANNLAGAIAMAESKMVLLQERLSTSKTDTQFNTYNRQIAETTELLKELKKRRDEFNKPNKGDDLLSKNITKYQEYLNAVKLTDQQKKDAHENDLKRLEQLQQAESGFQQASIAARTQSAQLMVDDNLKKEELASIHEEQLRLIVENGQRSRQNIETQFADEKGFNQAQRDELERMQVQSQRDQILAIEAKYQQDSMNGFEKWANQSKATLQKVSDTAKITLVTGIGNSFVALGGALQRGEDGLAAFGKAFIGVLGDIAIQTGNMFIALAFANTAIPVFGLSGFGAFAAGAALLTLGGVLKAISGSSATASVGGGGVAAGQSGSVDNTFNPAAPITDQRVSPNTVVNFTVQGDVFDSDLTQTRVAELLNSAIDTKGVVIRGI